MTGLLWAVLGLCGAFLLAALGDLVSEEVRGWLDRVPRALLRLAAAGLPADSREVIYREVWLPDLCYYLRGDESRPITRLIRGTSFAADLFRAARRVDAPAHARVAAGGDDFDFLALPSGDDGFDYVVRLDDGRLAFMQAKAFGEARLNPCDIVTFETFTDDVVKHLRGLGQLPAQRDGPFTIQVVKAVQPPEPERPKDA